MTTVYEPDAYWEARGGESYRAYVNSPEYAVYREEQARFFSRLVAELNPRTLLDFGCGTGKLFPFWSPVPEVHGYDRSRSQLAVAHQEALRICPGNPYSLMCGAACGEPLVPSEAEGSRTAAGRTRLPYDNEYFDLVVAAEVLLHVVPGEIAAMVAELHRVCRGTLAIVTAAPFDNPAPHNFNHDYLTLLQGWFAVVDDHVQHAQRYLVGRRLDNAAPGTPAAAGREKDHALVTS